MKFLQGLRFVILKYNQDLHANCYLNDDKMIITSLNLYEFSMNNNKEMGVLIDLNDESDKELFDQNIEFALLKLPGGWAVLELNNSWYYTSRLMIDNAGEVYGIGAITEYLELK